MYKILDLGDLDRTFSAYQRQQEHLTSSLTYDTEVVVKGSPKPKELSLVDGRRAQNCTILLSKIKMTSQSLSRAILTMDTQEELPKDMCEQVSLFLHLEVIYSIGGQILFQSSDTGPICQPVSGTLILLKCY